MALTQRLSLRWLVPGLLAVILVAAVSVFGAVAYRAVRASMLTSASERLRTVARTFSQGLGQNPAWVREMGTVASNADVVNAVRSTSAPPNDSARAALSHLVSDTGVTILADVRANDGRVVMSVARPVTDRSLARSGGDQPVTRNIDKGGGAASHVSPEDLRLAATYGDTAATSPLYLRGDQVLYERAVPIHANKILIGHVVEVRTVTMSPQPVRTIAALIGKDAALVIGNPDGSLWTDLSKPVAHPPPTDTLTYTRDGRRWMAAMGRLPMSPWYLSVEFPRDVVLAPARALMWRFVTVGFLVIVLSVVAAERMSRRVTLPIANLTAAAESIAGGDLTSRGFVLNRPDEIGRLSRAFGVMADSIRDSQQVLESEIRDRTAELEDTLVRLRDAQDELVRKERLATLGQLSSSIGHELRNPLGVMTNALFYLEMVLHDAPPKVRDHLGKIHAQVRLSEAIISGLLDYARVRKPERATVKVTELVDAQLARVNVPSSVRVERDIPAILSDVFVDPLQVGQIVVNLFSNAVQAMGVAGGTMSIVVRPLDSHIELRVADTGPGVPADIIDKIFEPLFTTKARGIGLGLAVARTLARANGGELAVANRASGGAEFTLTLPCVAAEPGERAGDETDRAAADRHAMGAA